jgi:CheY-like chemotaxis protein
MTRILLVDDEELAWLEPMARALPDYDLAKARSYPEAVTLIESGESYDLAVVDLNLAGSDDRPAMDNLGAEILKLLRQRHPSIRLIALTGQPSASTREIFYDYDVDDLLIKGSGTLRDLRKAIKVALARTSPSASPGMRERRSVRWDDFRRWRDDATWLLDQQIRTTRRDLRDAGLNALQSAKSAEAQALADRLAGLEAQKKALGRESSDIDTALGKISSELELQQVEDQIKRLKAKYS